MFKTGSGPKGVHNVQVIYINPTQTSYNTVKAQFHWENHTAHWKRYDSGHAFMEVEASTFDDADRAYLSIKGEEHTEDSKSHKEVWLTLQGRDAIRALRDMCDCALGAGTPDTTGYVVDERPAAKREQGR